MRAYVRWVLSHAKLVLICVAAITVFFATRIHHLYVEVSLDDNLPQQHPYVQTFNQIDKSFGQRDVVIAALQVRRGTVLEPKILEMVSQITADFQALPSVSAGNVLSITARKVKDIKGTPSGMEVKPLIGDFTGKDQDARALAEVIARNPVYQQSIISKDLKTTAIVIDFKQDPSHDYSAREKLIRDVVERRLVPGVVYGLSGASITMAGIQRYTEKLKVYFVLAIIIIGLVHFEAFRTLQGLLLPLLTALLSVLWSTGFLCSIGLTRLDPATGVTPLLILAVAAGHAVQILKRYYEERARVADKDAAIEESLVKVGPVMIVAGAAAAGSFLSLLTFSIRTIREFGLYSAAGIVAALTVEMTFIPALRSLLPSSKERRHREGTLLEALLVWVLLRVLQRRHFKWVLSGAGILFIACLGLATRIRVDNSPKRNFPAYEQLVIDDHWMNSALGGSETLSFLIEGRPDDLKEPAVLRAADRLQSFLESDARIGKTIGLPYFIKTMNQAMHEGKTEFHAIPESRELIAQYLLLYSMSGDPGDFDAYVTNNYDQAHIIAFLKTSSSADAEQLIARADQFIAREFPKSVRVRVGGSVANFVALNQMLVESKLRNILQIFTIILVLGSLLFRSVAGGMLVVVPVLMTVVINFGFMGLAGIRLDLASSIISALAVGLGADYAIYFICRFKEEISKEGANWDDAMRTTAVTTGKGVFFVSSAIALGYLAVCFSPFAFHYIMGLLVALSMVVSSTVSLTVLPVLLCVFKPAFLKKSLHGPVRAPI